MSRMNTLKAVAAFALAMTMPAVANAQSGTIRFALTGNGDLSGCPGDTLTVILEVHHGAIGFGLIMFEATIAYDTSIMTSLDAAILQTNIDGNGEVRGAVTGGLVESPPGFLTINMAWPINDFTDGGQLLAMDFLINPGIQPPSALLDMEVPYFEWNNLPWFHMLQEPFQGLIDDGTVEVFQEGCQPTFPIGDVDCSGIVDIDDVPAFVNVLLEVSTTPCHVAAADVNGDGARDGLDVQSLVDALLGL